MSSNQIVSWLVTLVVALVGGGGGVQWMLWRQQRRNMAAQAVLADAQSYAIILEPFERSVRESERRAVRAEQLTQQGQNEIDELREESNRQHKRADRAEMRFARLEQYLEGPLRGWLDEARAAMLAAEVPMRKVPLIPNPDLMAPWRDDNDLGSTRA